MSNLTVGQTVVVVPVGHSRYDADCILATVLKIGRKYFTIDYPNERGTKVNLETMQDKTNFGHGHTVKVWRSEKEYNEHREHKNLWNKLGRIFGAYGGMRIDLSLAQLRQIVAIIETKRDCDKSGDELNYDYQEDFKLLKWYSEKFGLHITVAEHTRDKYLWNAVSEYREERINDTP